MIKYKSIIGRAEIIGFPDLMLTDIPAKTDTGAYSSSIHAENIKLVKGKNGKPVLQFDLLKNHTSAPYSREEIKMTKFKKETIYNSFGHSEERYKVDFKVRIGGKVFNSPFTLADRSTKPFPILLGRTLINKRFMVDTDLSNFDRKTLKIHLKEWLVEDDNKDSEGSI